VRWHLTAWQVGLGMADKWHGHSLESLLTGRVSIAQRDPAAASQQALDRARADAGIASLPAGPLAAGHLDAARIATHTRGAGVTMEAAARAFGLEFLALEPHIVEIWIDERWVDHPGVSALGELLASKAFTDRVAHFGGYDLTGCGERVGL
jgi:putative molybdopterin biosynthesis protein